METQRKQIQLYAESLRLTHLKKSVESTIHQAQIDKPTYSEYTLALLEQEVKKRRETDYWRRLKMAGLPITHDLDYYDFNFSTGFSGLPAGTTFGDGTFYFLGTWAYFWTSNSGGYGAWNRNLKYDSGQIYRGTHGSVYAFSVRCLMD